MTAISEDRLTYLMSGGLTEGRGRGDERPRQRPSRPLARKN